MHLIYLRKHCGCRDILTILTQDTIRFRVTGVYRHPFGPGEIQQSSARSHHSGTTCTCSEVVIQ
eukprot:876630-Rhodomonas_salina.1